MSNNLGCKCEAGGVPPCGNQALGGRRQSGGPLRQNSNAPKQPQQGGCPADYKQSGGATTPNSGGSGGCPTCPCSKETPPQTTQTKPTCGKTPQAKLDPAQSLFDRYNLCCPGQKCQPQEQEPLPSTGRKLKMHKNGFDLYDSEIARPRC